MSAHAEKTQGNKKQSQVSSNVQKQIGGDSTFQLVSNRPESIAQKELQDTAANSPQVSQLRSIQDMADNHSIEQIQPIQKKENNTGLPDDLKTGMENLSGMSLDDVSVHRNSDKPEQLQAHAYAQGTDIHLAPGQEEHLPHEAWHVVQQKQGRVKPTMQMKAKVNVNDDAGLEKEADVMGAKALSMVEAPVQGKFTQTALTGVVVQRNPDDMSPSLTDTKGIDAIDKKANAKRMAVAKQEYLLVKMSELVELVTVYRTVLGEISEEGASITALNNRLKKLVVTGMAISALGIGLTIATGGVAAPIALLIGLSTLCPGAVVTLGKTVTKKSRNKKIKALGQTNSNGVGMDVAEQGAGAAALTTEAVGDFAGTTAEVVGEAAGGVVGGIGILFGVNDIREAQKVNIGKILGPKFANEQMINIEGCRTTLARLESKSPDYPIQMMLSPEIDKMQANVESLLGV